MEKEKKEMEYKTDLEKYFHANAGRLIHKWQHYFDIYDRHFSKFRGKEVVVLEIGVFQGGSLQMWKNYFGDKARIIGIDVNPECKKFEEENIEIYIGSQSDRSFWRELKSKIPDVDILIDDGGHTMNQQIVTFEEMYGKVKSNGVFLCEDLHTSYWLNFGGGYKRYNTFIEYSKNMIDKINAFHSKSPFLKVDKFTKSTDSLHYYDSILVIEKRERETPKDIMNGKMTNDYNWEVEKGVIESIKNLVRNIINNFFRLIGLNRGYYDYRS